MNSIETLRLDFISEVKQLQNIHNRKLFDDCIFVGSGDSYVAGLIAEYLTNYRCRCLSPSDLSNSRIIKDKTYCFISVTGKTRANIDLARRASQAGVTTVAITLNEKSELAQVCNEVVLPKITTAKSSTTGFAAFVTNVITCLQISGAKVPPRFDIWNKIGGDLSLKLIKSKISPHASTYILGNSSLFAVALYASLKLSEFFCTRAIAYKLEEFCHAPIFGIKKSDYLWILGQNELRVSKRLKRLGLNLSYVELYNPDIFARLFVSIFFVQNLMLLMAYKYRYTNLKYLLRRDILKASSDIIYDNL